MVFPNEQELKQHRLREHNEQLSRNERRAALQIPVNLTVRWSCCCSIRMPCADGSMTFATADCR